MSDFSSGNAVLSSNRPPLNQATVSKSTRPPVAITSNRSPTSSVNRSGAGRAMPQHPREHVVRKQADVVGEHAEDEPVDEVRDRLRFVAALAQRLGNRRERGRHLLVSDCRVSPGRSRSGSENAHFSRSRVDASAKSSSSNSCVRLTLFVQLVRIRNRTMSETISSGGFSSASEYCRSWSKAALRSARFPLYSQWSM